MQPESSVTDSKLMRLLDWVIDLEPQLIAQDASALKLRYPGVSNEILAQHVFAQARWKATASGALTGLPGNLMVAAPAALLDVTTLLRLEAHAAARVACLYHPDFLQDEEAKWEVLVPVFGLSVVSQIARQAGMQAGMAMSRTVLRKLVSKGSWRALKRILAQHFGARVSQRALITKTVPLVGALIGGAWNYGEVTLLRARCVRYFAEQDLEKVAPRPQPIDTTGEALGEATPANDNEKAS
jgi:hypothetical protein